MHAALTASSRLPLLLPFQDEKAAQAAADMEVDEETPSTSAAQPKTGGAGEEKSGGKLHVLGIGGRRAKRGGSKATGTKKTPGEIRIQKGERAVKLRLPQLWLCLSGHTAVLPCQRKARVLLQ